MSGFGMRMPYFPGKEDAVATQQNDITTVFQHTNRCPICMMKYSNPRRLPCDHSFCKTCLQGELDRQKQSSSSLTCVVCQEPVVLPKNGVDQLDSSLYTQSIVEFYQRSPMPTVQCMKCNGAYCSSCVNVICNRCDKYVSTEFCSDCFEGFCTRCAEEHEKTTGDHILLDIDQAHDIMKENSEADDEERREEVEDEGESERELEKERGEEEQEKEVEKQEDIEEDGKDNDSSDESELNFVYEVNREEPVESMNMVDDNGDDNHQTAKSWSGTKEVNEFEIHMPEEAGGYMPGEIESLSSNHSELNAGDDRENEEEYMPGEAAESPSSSQSGFQFVYKVNAEDDNESSTENQEEEDEEEDAEESNNSPTSSQSDVAMAYNVNEEQSQDNGEEDGEEEAGIHEDQEERSEEPNREEGDQRENGRQKKIVTISPVVSYDRVNLEEFVNATVDVNVPPEEALRLSPSAPKNDKRRRVARIKPDVTHEPKLPETYYEIQSLKWCSRITIGFVVVLTLCTLTFAGLAITTYLLKSEDKTAHVFEDHWVLMDNPKPFWVRSLSIASSGAYDSAYHYETDLYMTKCNSLELTSSQYTLNKTGTQPEILSDVTVDIHTAANDLYAYLAPGSSLMFEIRVWSDYTPSRCISELNIYDDYDNFREEEGLRAVYTACVDVGRSAFDEKNVFTYNVDKADFYFATLSVPSEGSYSVNTTVNAQNYSPVQEDYIDKCTITSSLETTPTECSFGILETSIVLDTSSYCLMADTRPLVSSSTPSFVKFSLSPSPNIFRNIAYIVIVIPLPLYFIMCLLVWICFKTCNVIYVKCKNKHFRHEYLTEI